MEKQLPPNRNVLGGRMAIAGRGIPSSVWLKLTTCEKVESNRTPQKTKRSPEGLRSRIG